MCLKTEYSGHIFEAKERLRKRRRLADIGIAFFVGVLASLFAQALGLF
jgi:hypothetical protein